MTLNARDNLAKRLGWDVPLNHKRLPNNWVLEAVHEFCIGELRAAYNWIDLFIDSQPISVSPKNYFEDKKLQIIKKLVADFFKGQLKNTSHNNQYSGYGSGLDLFKCMQ